MSRVRIPSPAPTNPLLPFWRPLRVNKPMKPLLALLFTSLAFAQNYKAEPAGAPPSDLTPAFASLMMPTGYKISGPNGVFCEVWFRNSIPSGKKSAEDGVAPQRDFLVLTPAADDKDPNSTPAQEELMTMSKKASGTPHPAVFSMEPP